MHKSRLAGFIIDCRTDDLNAAARFWSAALGLTVRTAATQDPLYRTLETAPDQPHLEVQQVQHESRVHLDIESDDIEAEVRRLEKLGARRLGTVKSWCVLEAPTGQRFCVVRPQRPTSRRKLTPGTRELHSEDIHFPPKHEPLRDDVHALGALLGEILREQGGEQLFELVELDRVAAIRGRAGSREARVELAACVRDRPPALARDLLRAFSTWFQVVNLAEKVHRIRRRREYFLKDSQRPQPGGVEDAIATLKASRAQPRRGARAASARSRIEPVFAAHSTEASRRTLAAQAAAHRAAAARAARPDPRHRMSRARNWSNIRIELTTAWQTEELPRERLTVADEREQVLFYLVGDPVSRGAGVLRGDRAGAREALRRTRATRSSCPSILHFGSWVGGDMDGNPDVHAKTIRETLARQQQVILNWYYEECQVARAAPVAEREPHRYLAGTRRSAIEEYMQAAAGRARNNSGAPRPHALSGVPGANRRATALHLRGASRAATRTRTSSARTLRLIASACRANKGVQRRALLRRAGCCGGSRHSASIWRRWMCGSTRAYCTQVIAQGLGDPQWAGRSRRERRELLAQALETDRGPVGELGCARKPQARRIRSYRAGAASIRPGGPRLFHRERRQRCR